MSNPGQLAMSDEAGRVPPQQAVFSDLLSLSYPASKRTTEFYPQNGSVFNPSAKNVIEIPLACAPSQWIDLSNSYLRIKVNNKNADATHTFGWLSPHDFIARWQILGTNSELLEDVQSYNRVARMLCAHQLGTDGLIYNNHLGSMAQATNGWQSATNPLNNLVAGGDSRTLCFQPISGVINCAKYLPIGMARNRSLTLRIELENSTNAVRASNGASIEIDNVVFVADVINMSDTFNMRFRDMIDSLGSINIHYTTYKQYQDSISSGTEGTVLIPDSSRSLKSIFTIFNESAANGVTQDCLQLHNPHLTQFQYTVNSAAYPQAPVSQISHHNQDQAFATLHTALGQLGSITSRVVANRQSYYNNTNVRDNSRIFAIGICCEAHNRSSNLLESGENLSQSTAPIRLDLKFGSAQTNESVYTFTLSDRLLSFDAAGNLSSTG